MISNEFEKQIQHVEILKRCEHFCIKRNRQCKLLAAKSKRFCGEHFTHTEENKQV
jgi:hypothetical protein